MAAQFFSRSARPLGSLRWARWLAYHLLSFETFFLLFLYGPLIRQILPPIPENEAYVFGVVTIAMGGWIILRDGLYLRGLPIFMAGLAFFGWLVLSIGWTPSKVIVWENLRFILTIDLWALFAGACIVAGSRERVARLLIMIMLLALLLAVIGLYIEFVYGSFRFYGYRGGVGVWAQPAYISWGYIVSTGGAFALAIVILSRLGSPRQVTAFVVLGVCTFFLLIAGGRGPLLGVVLAGLLVTFVELPRISNGRIELPQAQIMALAVIAIAVVYISYIFATGQTLYTLNRLLTLFDQADDPLLRTGANRFDQFAGAYRLWLESPLFGHGLASYYYLYGAGYETPGNHPHNIILQILAEFGLVGLVLFAVFIIAGLRNISLARLRRDPLCLAIVMVFTPLLMQTLVAGDVARSYRFFVIVGLLAMRAPMAEDDEGNDEADDAEEEEEEEERNEDTTAAR